MPFEESRLLRLGISRCGVHSIMDQGCCRPPVAFPLDLLGLCWLLWALWNSQIGLKKIEVGSCSGLARSLDRP